MPGQELMEEQLEAAIQVCPCDITLLGCAAQCENSFVKFGKLYFCVLSLVFKRRSFNILWPFRHVSRLRFVFSFRWTRTCCKTCIALSQSFNFQWVSPIHLEGQSDPLKLVMLLVMLLRQVQTLWKWLKRTKQATKADCKAGRHRFGGSSGVCREALLGVVSPCPFWRTRYRQKWNSLRAEAFVSVKCYTCKTCKRCQKNMLIPCWPRKTSGPQGHCNEIQCCTSHSHWQPVAVQR
jgi:hypothetical protein